MSTNPFSSFKDFLPDDHEYLTYIKKVLRHRCRQAGFRRISPSLAIDYDTYTKAFAENSKEIESNKCILRCKKSKTKGIVRFDPVFSLARSYVNNQMNEWPQPVELYFIEDFFRNSSEDISKETEFGVQIIGSSDAALSAQIIYFAHKLLDDLGLRELYSVQINHIGSIDSRKVYLDDLKNFYFDKKRSLCENCLAHGEKGAYLELLRCQEEDCSILAQLAPKLENYLNKEDSEQYAQLKGYLDELKVEYKENKGLFGMKSYNAHTVFEFWHNDKGADDIILSGGSNDEIIEKLGGDKTNMIGFATDTMKLIESMKEGGIRVPHKDHLQVFVAQLGLKAKRKAVSLLEQLREIGIQTVGAMGTGSMREQLDMATNFKVKHTLLMGEVEVNEGMIIIRDMEAGTQESVPYDKVVEIMKVRIGKEKMDVMEEKEKSVDLK